jgi:DNA repair exonuclease SbcCD ATPase subunit
MEKEQLEQKVEWLDAEHRKALATIAALEKRLEGMEKNQTKRESSSKTLATYKARLDALDTNLAELEKQIKMQEAGSKQDIQTVDKQAKQLETTFLQENKGLSKIVEDFRKESGQLQALQKNINEHGEKIRQSDGRIESLSKSIQDVIGGEQKRGQLAQSLEQSSREDIQRLSEMRAEVAALLTRLESAAKQTEGIRLSQNKVEKRVKEMSAAEEERKEAHDDFLTKAALAQTNWQHQWKEWGKRFEAIEQQSSEVAERLKEFESTELALKRAQRAFDELVEKINRRVNELSEIQRLGDQRFRQEWSTFQADGQKRWSNFTLMHEEQQREGARQQEKLAGQVAQLEDNLREVQDTLQHHSEQSERNLQNLLEMARDSLVEHERFLSSNSR